MRSTTPSVKLMDQVCLSVCLSVCQTIRLILCMHYDCMHVGVVGRYPELNMTAASHAPHPTTVSPQDNSNNSNNSPQNDAWPFTYQSCVQAGLTPLVMSGHLEFEDLSSGHIASEVYNSMSPLQQIMVESPAPDHPLFGQSRVEGDLLRANLSAFHHIVPDFIF